MLINSQGRSIAQPDQSRCPCHPKLWYIVSTFNRKKIGSVNAYFSACAACTVRITFISSYGKTGDFLWDSTYLTIWSVSVMVSRFHWVSFSNFQCSSVECCIGIIAVNLSCLKPLLRSAFGTTYGNNNSPSQSGMKTITVDSTIHKHVTQVTSRDDHESYDFKA
jgi:hypothetical protein